MHQTSSKMLTLIMGPMQSGKSTLLLAYERRFHFAKKRMILVKWSGDNRYTSEAKIITHDGISNNVHYKVYTVSKLAELEGLVNINDVDVILIDEGQFYPDLKDFCDKVANQCQIVVSCLSGDFKQRPFQSVVDVLGMADNIIHQKSICTLCGMDAPFTVRMIESQEQILVGDGSMYEPRCRECLHKNH
jgi:thymidine kinase